MTNEDNDLPENQNPEKPKEEKDIIFLNCMKKMRTTSRNVCSNDNLKEEEALLNMKKRIQKLTSNMVNENRNKKKYMEEKIEENNSIVKLVSEAVLGEEVNLDLLKEAISFMDRIEFEESSLIDITNNISHFNDITNYTNQNISDDSNIMDTYGIKTVNEDTKKLINVISCQNKIIKFYSLISGLEIIMKDPKECNYNPPSFYDKNDYTEFRCTFMPGVLKDFKNHSSEPLCSFVLRHNKSLKEIEYSPAKPPNKTNGPPRTSKEALERTAYFDDSEGFQLLSALFLVYRPNKKD